MAPDPLGKYFWNKNRLSLKKNRKREKLILGKQFQFAITNIAVTIFTKRYTADV